MQEMSLNLLLDLTVDLFSFSRFALTLICPGKAEDTLNDVYHFSNLSEIGQIWR